MAQRTVHLAQEDTEGMAGMSGSGMMVADAIFYNRVGRAPYWYTPSETTTVVQVIHVLQTGIELQGISPSNKLPVSCNRALAMRQKAVMIARQDHDIVMDEAMRRDVLEYDDTDEEEEDEESGDGEDEESSDEDDELGSEVESE